ncbi:MAG: LytTR family DNA-binding domain-containing protein [Gemmatimonadota bacterium]
MPFANVLATDTFTAPSPYTTCTSDRRRDPFARVRAMLARRLPAALVTRTRSRSVARARFPLSVSVFWSLVVGLDFVNDWIIEGLTTTFRPVGAALTDMIVWWTPWIAVTPLLAVLIDRLDPARIGWRRSMVLHAPLLFTAIGLHALLAAWAFSAMGGGTVANNFAHFARAFTLSEALLYVGLATALHVGWVSGPAPAQAPDTEPGHGPRPTWVRRFAVREGEVTRFVGVEDVSHIEAAGNYVRLHAADGEHLIRATLAAVEERLDPSRFRRIHRSTIVNVDQVARVDAWFNGDCLATLTDGRELRVSRTYRAALLDPLG